MESGHGGKRRKLDETSPNIVVTSEKFNPGMISYQRTNGDFRGQFAEQPSNGIHFQTNGDFKAQFSELPSNEAHFQTNGGFHAQFSETPSNLTHFQPNGNFNAQFNELPSNGTHFQPNGNFNPQINEPFTNGIRFQPNGDFNSQVNDVPPNGVRFQPNGDFKSQVSLPPSKGARFQPSGVDFNSQVNVPPPNGARFQSNGVVNGSPPNVRFQTNPGFNGINSVQNANGNNYPNPEKRKLIQQQLVLLLHAHKCMQRDEAYPNGNLTICKLEHCHVMKNVLVHMSRCRAGRGCSSPHCASSRQIINHWRECHQPSCAVCFPLRQMTVQRQNALINSENISAMFNGTTNNSFATETRLANGSSIVAPDTQARSNDYQTTLGLSENGLPLYNGSNENNFTFSAVSQVPPEDGTLVKRDWHKDVTKDLRDHLVTKIVNAIFPSPDPSALNDIRLQDLLRYARKVEKDTFENGKDREDYYHRLAQKIYKIQKELLEKKNKRLEQANFSEVSVSTQNMPNLLKAIDSTVPPNRVAPQKFVNDYSTAVKMEVDDEFKVETYQQSNCVDFGAQPKTETESFTFKTEENCELKIEPKIEPVSHQSVDNVKYLKKVLTVDDICSILLPVWEKLNSAEESLPFREPVNTTFLNCPDYFKVVKNPMDLSTIKTKLLNGNYKDPWQFCDDVWLMFDNAWLYNRKNSKVYKLCSKLSETFSEEIDPVMKSIGFCCGKKLSFTPLAIVCFGQPMCSIPRDTQYYLYETKPQFGVPDRYTYCKKCLEDVPGDFICLSDDPTSASNLVNKSEFKLLKNDVIEYENYVDCVDCGRKWHQICASHVDSIYPGGFVCDLCLKLKNISRPENRFTAKRLPTCKLSSHLETRVNNYLRKNEPSSNDEVIIRVLASSDKEVEIKPFMKTKYAVNGEMPEKFPYRTKAIFAFEVIDGVEVCFFGLHVQEYGDKASPPNSRRVYIAYLDSVHFFQPKEHRTAVYHELLLAYLEYSKALGYTMAHIWACPPSEGDDYIFHCHPLEQRIPKPKRLQEWYKKLLDQGIIERIVLDYKDIYKQAVDDNVQSLAQLPYFEGDYWPNVFEENISWAENEKNALESSPKEIEETVDDLPTKKPTKGQKKNKQKSKGSSSKKSKKTSGEHGNGIVGKVLSAMEKHKEVFFVVQLHSVHSAAVLGPIVDPDPLINCELMESRDAFLSTCRERHWEFSSLRRAKWSTIGLCHELHTQGQEKIVFKCDSCQSMNAKWHCTVCEDFDLCQKCYETKNHPHKLEPIRLAENDGTPIDDVQRNRFEATQRALQLLPHACTCRNANCKIKVCCALKRNIAHAKECRSKGIKPDCPFCSKVLALCYNHAKQCQEVNCPVLYCTNMRKNMAEKEAQKKKKRDLEMCRRINLMGKQSSALPANDVVVAPQMETSYNAQHSLAPSSSSASFASGSSLVSSLNAPPNGAVLAAKAIERLAAHQSSRYPDVAPSGRMSFQSTGNVSLPPGCVSSWNGSSSMAMPPPNFTVHPRMPNDIGESSAHQSIALSQDTRPKLALQQRTQIFHQALKAAKTAEDKKRITLTLKNDPELLHAFLQVKQSPVNQIQAKIETVPMNYTNQLPVWNNTQSNVVQSMQGSSNFYQNGFAQHSTTPRSDSFAQPNRMMTNFGDRAEYSNGSTNGGYGVYYQSQVNNFRSPQQFEYATDSPMTPNFGYCHSISAQQNANANGGGGSSFYGVGR